MTQIKKITDKQGNDIYLRTHTKAVIDDNGYTAESRLQAMQDEINQAQLAVGAVPSDLTPTYWSTNWVTSGGIYNVLPKNTNTLFENTTSTEWLSGNISNGNIVTTYANRYLVIELPENIGVVDVESSASAFNLQLHASNSASSGYVWKASRSANSSLSTSINLSGYSYLCLILWDKPTTAQAQQEVIKITYKTLLENLEVTNDFFEDGNYAAGASLTNALGTSLYIEKLTTGNGITWIQGGINTTTGKWESNNKAICTQPIYLLGDTQAMARVGKITNETGRIAVYDENGTYQQWKTLLNTSSYPNGYIRFVFYGSVNITPEDGASSNAYVIRRMGLKNRIEAVENKVSKIYNNPILRVDFPDPTVWDGEDGYFYALATGGVTARTMYRSANLVDWENTGELPYSSEVAQTILSNFGSSTSYWAPCVYKVKEGQWNMYLTKPNGGVAFLTSKYPTYGYKFVRFTTASFGNYIDPDVARDRDGSVWMFAGSDAMMFRRQMTDDALDFAENSEWVHVAGRPSNESGNTNRVKTFEGEYLYRRNGYWYLFCSSGQYGNNTYAIRVVRSATLDGTFVDKEGNLATDGYAETILSSGGELYGPGHNAQIFVDTDNRTWMLYHSHWNGFSSSSYRGMCIDEVLWDENGWPYFSGGTPSLSHVAPSVFR